MDLPLVDVDGVLVWCVLSGGWVSGCVTQTLLASDRPRGKAAGAWRWPLTPI